MQGPFTATGESAGLLLLAPQARGPAALVGMVDPATTEELGGGDTMIVARDPLTPEAVEWLQGLGPGQED